MNVPEIGMIIMNVSKIVRYDHNECVQDSYDHNERVQDG